MRLRRYHARIWPSDRGSSWYWQVRYGWWPDPFDSGAADSREEATAKTVNAIDVHRRAHLETGAYSWVEDA